MRVRVPPGLPPDGIMGAVQTMTEALMAIPEPPGVTLYRMPPADICGEPGSLAVRVGYVSGTAGPEGRGAEGGSLFNMACDKAHDLSRHGPQVYVWPEAGGSLGVLRWTVCAIGFVEAEAREAFRAVCAAIDGTGKAQAA